MYLKTNSNIAYMVKTIGIMILFVVGGFLAGHAFEALQDMVQNSQQYMVFIRGNYLEPTFLIITGGMMFLYISSQDSLGYIKIIKYIKVQLIWVLFITASIMALYVQFYSFTGIGEKGIVHRSNAFDKQIEYSWEDIEKVSVCTFYEKGHMPQTPTIYYSIFPKGHPSGFNLREAKNFWEKILVVDEFMTKKGIPVSREKIDELTVFNLLSGGQYDCDREQAENVLIRIFEILYRPMKTNSQSP